MGRRDGYPESHYRRFNAIAKRHGVVNEDAQQPEDPVTIVVDAQGTIAQIFTTEGTDFEIRLRGPSAIFSLPIKCSRPSQDPEYHH